MSTTCPLVNRRLQDAFDLQQVAKMLYENARIQYICYQGMPLMFPTIAAWQQAAASVYRQSAYLHATAMLLEARTRPEG